MTMKMEKIEHDVEILRKFSVEIPIVPKLMNKTKKSQWRKIDKIFSHLIDVKIT